VSRRSLILLIASGALLVGFSLAALAERERAASPPLNDNAAARPQTAVLDWSEAQGPKGERLVFGVKRFQILPNGWRARVSLENDSRVAFSMDRSLRAFGLMLFPSGVHSDLAARIREQALPTMRPALTYDPDLPSTLDPHATWKGTISARGALVAGSWVRFVFGYFKPLGKAPSEFSGDFSWITDHAYRLRRSARTA